MANVKFNCKTKIKDKEKILKERGLDTRGTVQQKFTLLLAKEMNNYVPYTTGRLKDDSIEIREDCIIYDTPYAKKQYYTNTKGGERNRAGRRGKKWDKRAWSEKGSKIIAELNKYVNGGSK